MATLETNRRRRRSRKAATMNRISTILCSVDFSGESRRAALEALRFGEQLGVSSLIFVHAFEPRAQPTSDGPITESSDSARSNAEARLAAFVSDLGASAIPVRALIVEGDPVSRIVHTADAQTADLIVMGTHGRSGIRRAVMGSVAEGVTRRSHVPVMIVRGG